MNHPSLRAAIEAEERGELEQAVSLYAEVLGAQADCLEALNNLGAICFRHGQTEEAINFYSEALNFHPDYLPSRINLARCFAKLGRCIEADQHYRQAIARKPDLALEVERLQMLVATGNLHQAASEAEAACAAHPEAAELWLVSGNTKLYLCQPEGAEAAYRKALSLADSARARANLALALFAQSRFLEAWPFYEARYDESLKAHDAVRFTDYPWPRWQGEALAGKTILLVGEQGLGDQIQFARFIEPLAAQGAKVELICSPGLCPLLASTQGLHAIHAALAPDAEFDFWSPLLSVPLHLGCTEPRQTWSFPYLQADAGKRAFWHEQLTNWSGGKKKIGLAWRGAAGNATNRMRSIPVEEILALPRRLGAKAMFFSLQKDDASGGELDLLCTGGIIPLGDMLHDFSDTAALACELDLIISVDTSVAHAVGALGRPLHILMTPGIEWRWGETGSTHCALYPSAQLHWKDSGEASWLPIIECVCKQLDQQR